MDFLTREAVLEIEAVLEEDAAAGARDGRMPKVDCRKCGGSGQMVVAGRARECECLR